MHVRKTIISGILSTSLKWSLFHLFPQLLIAVVFSPAFASELLVPSDYRTIQQAIDAADDGDRILVASGTYSGQGFLRISFEGKAITVQGSSPDTCVIDCAFQDRAFEFHCGETPDSILRSIQIINGVDACSS